MIKQFAKLTAIIFTVTACGAPNDVDAISAVHGDITQAFPDVSHISAEDLEARLLTQNSDLLILDTRPAAEYNVSHIKGALQVSPNITPQDFEARFGELTANKTVIVYCSVGWRSSLAADRLTESIAKAGGRRVSNLEGGLFGWHNDGRLVVNAQGPTRFIHPYDKKWGQLVSQQDTLTYNPK